MSLFRSILVVDDEPSIRHVLSLVLTDQGYDVRAVGDGQQAQSELAQRPYDVVISDVRMPNVGGMELLASAKETNPDLTFIVMSAYGSKDQALEAISKGAYDFIQKPFRPEEVVFVLKKAEERRRLLTENRRLKGISTPSTALEALVGDSAPMQTLKKQISRVAPVTSTVLITGESGTGKELVAKAIHALSPRKNEAFVAVNCGAIPPGLIESELFGHAKGAFTDAKSAKRGLFAEADGGTIFLDEIGELPQSAQVKLLRVLQEGEIRPVGESKTERVNVRVVAATLRDLSKAIAQKEFREDLFFRLNVVTLQVPPLRARGDDVLTLTRQFMHSFSRTFQRQPALATISAAAEQLLKTYQWPGNVRELENAMERAVLMGDAETLEVEHLPEKIWGAKHEPVNDLIQPSSVGFSLKKAMLLLEEQFIKAALKETKGNRTKAAELLELSSRALLYKIKEYGIDPDS
jgi:two-component system, NtrC family, response regulator AtoC